jgi:HD-GYP domain-containing protein (c-di-GMP phosphodiesterase class II)
VSKPAAARHRVSTLLWAFVPIAITGALALYRPIALTRLDHAAYDVVLRLTPLSEGSRRVAIVDIDERSLTALGQWPWRRDLMATLIDRLREAGASVVALDIVFAEASRDGSDQALVETLRHGGVVLGYGFTFDDRSRTDAPCALRPINIATLESGPRRQDPPYFHATGAVCNLPMLADAADVSGFLNAAPDGDGILRRVPLVAEFEGQVYPSLALRAVASAIDARDFTIRVGNVNDSVLGIDDRRVPVDAKSNILLRYRGVKRTFPYVSAVDVINGSAEPAMLRDKIVFVGTTALGTREVVATPLDTLFPGVEVQATVADNLLQGDSVMRSTGGRIAEVLATLLLGGLVAVLFVTAGTVAGILGGVFGIAAFWFVAVRLLAASSSFVSPLFPTLGIAFTTATLMLVAFFLEVERADEAGEQGTATRRLMIHALLSLVETRDGETGRHSARTQQYSNLLAKELSRHHAFRDYLTAERVELLSTLAPLHDIGKVGIPDQILNKPGPLTPDELAQMRTHPALGRDVILQAEARAGVRDDETLALAKDIVYTHHERWNGTGYPRGLSGHDIPVAGRIMALVDLYDAARSRSLYRPPMSHDDVVNVIVEGKTTHFDPAVVDAFMSVSDRFKEISEFSALFSSNKDFERLL